MLLSFLKVTYRCVNISKTRSCCHDLPPPIPPVGMESEVTPLTVAKDGNKRQLQGEQIILKCDLVLKFNLHVLFSANVVIVSVSSARRRTNPYPLSLMLNSTKAGEAETL